MVLVRMLVASMMLAYLLAPSVVVSAQVTSVQDACLSASTMQMPSTAITIDNTAGGVSVLTAKSKRCAALIKNVGTADMNCAPTTYTVSTTLGWLVSPGETLGLTSEGREAWKCIRTTSNSTSVVVIEAVSK